jgi:hypothetical protein
MHHLSGFETDHPGCISSLKVSKSHASNARSTSCTNNLNSNWISNGPVQAIDQSLGFIQSVFVKPDNVNILFAGSENGGLFKSIDGGATWKNKTDGLEIPGLGIQDIQCNPFNTLEMAAATGGIHSYGAGIIYSTDAGDTWLPSQINYTTSEWAPKIFRQIRFDPNVNHKIWAIDDLEDVYVSIDNGQNFNAILDHNNDPDLPPNLYFQHRFLHDLEIIPANLNHPKIVAIAAHDINSGDAGAYIRCSMDDGNSWTYITPEPYIERINLDWVTTSGNSSDELKAMYSVNRPMVKFSEISYDLSTLGGTYPSSSEKPSGKK